MVINRELTDDMSDVNETYKTPKIENIFDQVRFFYFVDSQYVDV